MRTLENQQHFSKHRCTNCSAIIKEKILRLISIQMLSMLVYLANCSQFACLEDIVEFTLHLNAVLNKDYIIRQFVKIRAIVEQNLYYKIKLSLILILLIFNEIITYFS